MICSQLRPVRHAEHVRKLIPADKGVSPFRPANFTIAAERPLRGMSHSTRPEHVRIDINHAPDQMSATFHRGCVVSVIPEGALPFLPGAEFLSRSPGSQLHGFRDDIIGRVQYRQTDMIGSHRMVRYAEPASRL